MFSLLDVGMPGGTIVMFLLITAVQILIFVGLIAIVALGVFLVVKAAKANAKKRFMQSSCEGALEEPSANPEQASGEQKD